MKEYIEREAALLEIEEWADTFCECDYVWPHVIKSIRKLPAADVRPVVRAVWEDTPNPQWPAYDIRHCTCCGWSIPKSKLREKDLNWNFCPNCGADMRG